MKYRANVLKLTALHTYKSTFNMYRLWISFLLAVDGKVNQSLNWIQNFQLQFWYWWGCQWIYDIIWNGNRNVLVFWYFSLFRNKSKSRCTIYVYLKMNIDRVLRYLQSIKKNWSVQCACFNSTISVCELMMLSWHR